MNQLQKLRQKVASLNILVVDDENAIREQSIKFMKKFCNNVDSAVDGEDAFNKVNTNSPYDLILSDIRMPKMNGLELSDKLQEKHKEIFIALMTGSYELYDHTNANYDLYLEKPVNINNMTSMLEMLVIQKGL
ncbi:response regulator [Sulfurimonas sp.]|nr:response regulator [Sulfurimonas sp.]